MLISHRFSSVRMADRIFVLADGKVEAVGTHDELLARPGLYANSSSCRLPATGDEGSAARNPVQSINFRYQRGPSFRYAGLGRRSP